MEPLVIASVADMTVRALQIALVAGMGLIAGVGVWTALRRHRPSEFANVLDPEYDRLADERAGGREPDAELRQRADHGDGPAVRSPHLADRERSLARDPRKVGSSRT